MDGEVTSSGHVPVPMACLAPEGRTERLEREWTKSAIRAIPGGAVRAPSEGF